MDENKLEFLYKAASVLTSRDDKTYDILRSHYLRRSRVFIPFAKASSNNLSKSRCTHCFLEWKKGTQIRIKVNKLSKRQKKRIKCNKQKKNYQLNSKQLERICSFCGNISTIEGPVLNKREKDNTENKEPTVPQIKKHQGVTQNQQGFKNKKALNVYSSISQVFSVKNECNNLKQPTVPVKPNNKKKKDKFAGLCQMAVLGAAKKKAEIEKNNKLNLFLKTL